MRLQFGLPLLLFRFPSPHSLIVFLKLLFVVYALYQLKHWAFNERNFVARRTNEINLKTNENLKSRNMFVVTFWLSLYTSTTNYMNSIQTPDLSQPPLLRIKCFRFGFWSGVAIDALKNGRVHKLQIQMSWRIDCIVARIWTNEIKIRKEMKEIIRRFVCI